jgi:hypothetical protein
MIEKRLVYEAFSLIGSKGANRSVWYDRQVTGEGHASAGEAAGDQGGRADRAEADRSRSILLTLTGWTSSRLAEAFGVREDTVGPRRWKPDPCRGLKPAKSQAALRVAEPLLSAPVTNQINWTLARLADEIAAREGVTISKSQLPRRFPNEGAFAIAGPATR